MQLSIQCMFNLVLFVVFKIQYIEMYASKVLIIEILIIILSYRLLIYDSSSIK